MGLLREDLAALATTPEALDIPNVQPAPTLVRSYADVVRSSPSRERTGPASRPTSPCKSPVVELSSPGSLPEVVNDNGNNSTSTPTRVPPPPPLLTVMYPVLTLGALPSFSS